MTLDHRVHGEHDGGDLSGSEGVARPLLVGWRLARMHEPTDGRAVGPARLVDQDGVSRLAASDGAAGPRAGCWAAWASA